MSKAQRKNARTKSQATDTIETADTTESPMVDSEPATTDTGPNNRPSRPSEAGSAYPSVPPAWISQFQTDLAKMIEVKINESVGRLEERIDKRLDVLTSNIDKNKTSCEHTLQRVKQAESIAQDASNTVVQLKVEILKNSNELKSLQNELEDLRNRQMRKTLVFYGFPEKGSETWEESRQLLEKHFKTCGLEAVDIDRAHRANTRNNSNDRGKARPIFAEFVTWQDSSYILQNASKLSRFPKSHGSKVKTSGKIHIQKLYGKKTVEERNKMLKIRKFFLLTNPDWKVSLTYPAILHINKGFGFKSISLW